MPLLRRHKRHGVGSKAERMKWRGIFLGGILAMGGIATLSTHPHAIRAGSAVKSMMPRSLFALEDGSASFTVAGSRKLTNVNDCLENVIKANNKFNGGDVTGEEFDVNFCGDVIVENNTIVRFDNFTCLIDEELEFSCCQPKADDDENIFASDNCLTRELEFCAAEDLCFAELVPGSGNGAECLQDFEKGAGGAILYLFLLIYLFLALAIVCDDYFSYALDMLGDLMGMSSDVKGATFAAIGSSAPELFVSLADNVIANPPKSVGVGTIVGSAIFNILVIIGASGVVAGRTFGSIQLNWKPLARDSMFYIFSILALIAVVVTADEDTEAGKGQAEYYEGIILVILYGLYLLFMAFNQRIFDWVDAKLGIKKEEKEKEAKEEVVAAKGDEVDELDKAEAEAEGEDGVKDFVRQGTNKTTESARMKLKKRKSSAAGSALGKGKLEEDDNVEDEPYFSVLHWPAFNPWEDAEGDTPEISFGTKYFGGGFAMWGKRLYWLLVLPINLTFRLTIPDSRYDLFCEDKPDGPKNHRPIGYWLEFTMCIVHIAISSHFLVFSAGKFGCIVGIDAAVMGLTVLAAGTSVPDMITSVILTKNGEGDAAVANSIGSNVFDILIGLGLPWAIAPAIFKQASVVAVDAIGISIGFLFGVLIVLLGMLTFTKFKLNQGMGYSLLVLYGLYVIFELFIRPNTIDKEEE